MERRSYWICGTPSPLTKAVESILRLFPKNWTDSKAAEDADLLVIQQSESAPLAPDALRFFRSRADGRYRRVLILQAEPAIATSEQTCNAEWLFYLSDHRSALPAMVEWIHGPDGARDLPRQAIATEACRSLVEEALGAAFSQLNTFQDLLPSGSKAYFTANNQIEFYHSLLCITQNFRDQDHEAHKLFDQELFGANSSGRFLGAQQKRRFTETCEDLRRSLNDPVPDALDERRDILLIDDNPDDYLRLLHDIFKHFLPEYSLWVCKVDAKDPRNELLVQATKSIAAYRSSDHPASNIKSWLSNLQFSPLKSAGELDNATRSPLRELFRSARFVLVDQMYRINHGRGELLGPSLVRGLARLMRDAEPIRTSTQERAFPEIVALSRADEPGIIQKALRAGARDYALKSRLLSLPSVLARVHRAVSEPPHSRHRNYRALYQLPNETIGLLQAIKIPCIPDLHRGKGLQRDVSSSQWMVARQVADFLRNVPKPDLHVHLGSCMSTEFLVLASFVGLLRHDAQRLPDIFRLAEHLRNLRKGLNALEYMDCLGRAHAPKQKQPITSDPRTWIADLSKHILAQLKYQLGSPDGKAAYATLRSVLLEELNIPDYLEQDAAEKALEKKPVLDLALFAIRHSKPVARAWDKDDIIRVYLLTLAAQYTGNKGGAPGLLLDGNPSFNYLDLFSVGNIDVNTQLIASWKAARNTYYETCDFPSEGMPHAENLKKAGWQWPGSFKTGLRLDLASGGISLEFEPTEPNPEHQPIEYELSTGLRSLSLVEYLQGCEFSGAEHMKHPFLVHLYARQALMNFMRRGVFYAELRASPDGFTNEDLGFEFADVCRCLVEAFSQAQGVAMDVYRRSRSSETAGSLSADQDLCVSWMADCLGPSYSYAALVSLLSNEHGSSAANIEGEAAGCHHLRERHLPCKVSLIFVGKRHKSTREMILEAAAAAVMRPPGERPVVNAAQFVEQEVRRCRVVGFDLAGREHDRPPELFAEDFSRLSRLHIPLTIHAGENAPAGFIEDAILLLGARRIGHGLALTADKNLMVRVREDRVCIELCPICNHQTSHFTCPEDDPAAGRIYPLKTCLDYGIYTTINTDNPVISGTNLVREYFQASYAFDKKHGLSLWDALRLMRMGYVASFLHLPERRAMIEVVEQHLLDALSEESMIEFLRGLVDSSLNKPERQRA